MGNITASIAAILTSLAEEILQILPADIEGQLIRMSTTTVSMFKSKGRGITNIGDIDLTAWGAAHGRVETATVGSTHGAAVTATRDAARRTKARLGLTILCRVNMVFKQLSSVGRSDISPRGRR
jgi:hypothetical protein